MVKDLDAENPTGCEDAASKGEIGVRRHCAPRGVIVRHHQRYRALPDGMPEQISGLSRGSGTLPEGYKPTVADRAIGADREGDDRFLFEVAQEGREALPHILRAANDNTSE